MSKHIHVIAVAVSLVAGNPRAQADRRDAAVSRATRELAEFATALGTLQNGSWDPGRKPRDAAECQAEIAQARDHGLEDTVVLRDPAFEHAPGGRPSGGYHHEITLGEAGALCAEYASSSRSARQQFDAGQALEPFAGKLLWIANVEPGAGGRDAIAGFKTAAADCRAAVDRSVAAGATLDGKVVVRDVERTLDKARGDICDELAARVPDYTARHAAAVRARIERTLAPYKAAGIGGEKLELMIEYDGVYWRGAGGDIVSEPARLAKASVLFHWLQAADGTHVIRRYQFSGNKLVKKSEKAYRLQPGSDAYR